MKNYLRVALILFADEDKMKRYLPVMLWALLWAIFTHQTISSTHYKQTMEYLSWLSEKIDRDISTLRSFNLW